MNADQQHGGESRRQFLRRLGGAGAGLGLGAVLAPTALGGPVLPDPGHGEDAFWQAVRALYPLTRERAYLNTGGLGPAAYPVLEAVQQTMWAQQTISETGHDLIEAARVPVAAFFGADPGEIAFMRNATEGNATVAEGLDLRPGDEVVFDAHAHPGGSFAWLNRQKKDGIVVKLFEPDPTSAAGNLERIEAQLTDRTRVVQVSHITAPTGIHFPAWEIAELAHAHGCWFHIDGAQSAGQVPVDLHAIGCDSYATSGHKWLGAPHGTGVLYVKADRLDAVTPTETGAYGNGPLTELPGRYTYNPSAQRYEVGTRDAAQIQGIVAAVALQERIGRERIAARGQALATYLHERLAALGGVTVLTPDDPSLRASITTFRADRVPYGQLIGLLSEAGLRCRPVQERGLDAVRVSTHLFNNEAECDRVVAVTQAAVEA